VPTDNSESQVRLAFKRRPPLLEGDFTEVKRGAHPLEGAESKARQNRQRKYQIAIPGDPLLRQPHSPRARLRIGIIQGKSGRTVTMNVADPPYFVLVRYRLQAEVAATATT
jgi:hypothetical protein